jgi:anaerobic selenocysteine-containing dehydrogenase
MPRLRTMQRRDFIKLTAVTGTTTALASCGGGVENELIRFVPDEDITPGIAEWKPSVCPVCNAGCGMNVRVMDADVETVKNGQKGIVRMMVAKKLEGLATDRISRGGLCARGQAAIQITYHPDRLTQPMKRSGARGSAEFKPVSWDDAIRELVDKLDAIAGDRPSLVYLSRQRKSRRLAAAREFVTKFGGLGPVGFEPFGDFVLRHANWESFDHDQLPTFDLAHARFVISFGADFLGTWGSVVAQNAAYGEFRQGRPGVRGKLVQVESRMTTTGATADEWVPCRPGTEGVLALGLAHLIGGKSDEYTPEFVEKSTGVSAKRVERLAKELAEQKPAVAIVGGPALAHTNSLFTAMAVNALNAGLGSVGQPGGVVFTPGGEIESVRTVNDLRPLDGAKVLLLDGVDLVYGAPKAWKVTDTLAKVPFIASFSCFIDDTSAHADLILPDHSFLESWVDSSAESGSIEPSTIVAGPVMKPIHDTRSTVDVLIDVAGRLKSPIALSWKSAEEVAKSAGEPKFNRGVRNRQSAMAWAEPQFDGDAAAYPFHFLPYMSPAFGDGATAHLPWLQELPDPMVSAMWSSWVEINPKTAERLGVTEGDRVDVTSTQGTLRVPVFVSPAIAPDVVAMPMGQGHGHFTRYASGRGANAASILAPMTESATGALAWAATRVRVARAADADGSLIMFGAELRESPHEHEIR